MVALGAIPGAVSVVTAVAAFTVPPLALLGALHVRRAALPLALVSPLLWVLVWRLPASPWTALAADLLIVLAAVSLGRLTGLLAPKAALVVGVVVAATVDVWQVAEGQVQPVARALGQAIPPQGLPDLQQLTLAGASMGWGDAYLAALAGAIVACSLRASLAAALGTLLGGLGLGLLFAVTDLLPAPVPVVVGLLAAGVVEHAAVRAWAQAAVLQARGRTMRHT